LSGPFCAACGQRVVRDEDFSLWRLIQDWTAAAFSLDSRGLTTLRRLLLQPGRLSADYIAGRRRDTFSPFQIFVLITLAFFLLPDNYDILKAPARWFFQNVESLVATKMAALDMTREELAIAYDARVGTLSKLGLGVIVGLLALASWALGFGRMRPLGKHLVMIVHFFVIALALVLLMIPLFWVLFHVVEPPRWVGNTLHLSLLGAWLATQQRRVLGIGWPRAVLHMIVLIAVLGALIFGYRTGVSLLTLWSL
jgi:hypothetical protein